MHALMHCEPITEAMHQLNMQHLSRLDVKAEVCCVFGAEAIVAPTTWTSCMPATSGKLHVMRMPKVQKHAWMRAVCLHS